MEISLRKVGREEAEEVHALQVVAFGPLLEKYGDHETNPANEVVDRIVERMDREDSNYYLICLGDTTIRAVRVVFDTETKRGRISPIFILPDHQGKGFGQDAMQLAEAAVDADSWALNTILEEEGNCYLYEKLGYTRTPETRTVNERMTLCTYVKQVSN